MKIKLYFGNEEAIRKSGIGRALVHQKKALELNQIDYTTDKDDTDYDILHINTVFPDSIKEINKARKLGKKVVYHAHSTKEDFQNSFIFSNSLAPFWAKWLVYLYTKADYIITPTPYSKQLLEGYGINNPIVDISNGIDLEAYSPTNQQIEQFCDHFSIKEKDKVIISVGWLFERKGFDTFVEIAEKLPQYKFFWFGDIELSAPTMKIKKLLYHLPKNVILPGYVSGDLIKGAYGRCDLFFFPSREETEGIVVLEALASKCNVLVRDIPVFDGWLKDKINCYKGKDNEDFIDAIEKIITGRYPSRKEEGYLVAKERELSKIGEQLFDVYKKVLASDKNDSYESR